MRRLAGLALTAVLTAAPLTACGDDEGSPGAGGTQKIKVGALPIVDVAPLHLGVRKGLFRDEGLDVEVVNTTGGAAAVPGLVSGEFDFVFVNVASLILAKSQNLPLKALASGNASTGQQGKDFGGVVVPKDSTIASAKDLAGKQVAVNNLKNIGEITIRESIRKAGGDASSVRFVELPFPDMPAAVANKRVDAAWIVEPFFTVAQQQGAKQIASNFVDTAPGLTIATYVTTEKTVKEDDDLTRRFTTAIEKSLQYATEHPEEIRDVLTSYTQIKPDVAAKITLPAFPAEINKESVQKIADLMQTDGVIKERFDVSSVLP
jgi:NitT/TauT family transport system substrate-binding protein